EICARANHRSVRLPVAAAHRHQARLQERQVGHRHRGDQHVPRHVLAQAGLQLVRGDLRRIAESAGRLRRAGSRAFNLAGASNTAPARSCNVRGRCGHFGRLIDRYSIHEQTPTAYAEERDMPVIAGFDKLASVPEEQITDKIGRRVVSGKQGTMVYWRIKAGAHAAAHKHPHEQFVWMVTGTMEFRIGNEKRTMKPGDVAVIPGGVEHEGYFPEDSEAIDFFAPVREDFLTGAPPSYRTQR